ncbi:MAG: S-methyl-5-thioribose-1-phosphate isomerase [Fibrobacterota bacterium]
MLVRGKNYTAVWMKGRSVCMIDQRLLPHQFKIITFKDSRGTAEAIRNMTVRGAGSIGAAAGFGAAQVALEAPENGFHAFCRTGFNILRKTRPTAQDLFYAIDRVAAVVAAAESVPAAKKAAVATAWAISDDYIRAGAAVGRYGNTLIKKGFRILTHCNAGWLALQDWGSALAPIYAAKRAGKKVFVYADETRPRLQGARLTAWELKEEGVDFAVIADNAAGFYMRKGWVDMVITGADRLAANGDAANKIGTYEKAVLAKENGIPFYIAAPVSTFDLQCKKGDDIPIEERDEDEVFYMDGKTKAGKIERVRVMPEGICAKNPAFDVTPARYITAIITDRGIVKPDKVRTLFSK